MRIIKYPLAGTSLLTLLLTALSAPSTLADTPTGWYSNGSSSAYTLNAWSAAISGSVLAVDENIDFLDVREDLLAGNNRLVDNSGDLSGDEFTLQFGLGSWLTAFYTRRTQDLTLKLGPVSRVDLEDLDEELSTESTEYGLRWNFYEAGRSNDDIPWHAASLEVSRIENSSDDFTARIQRIRYSSNLTIDFVPPQQFQLDQMEDEGWQARLLYSWPLARRFTGTVWGGYAIMDASSGTGVESDERFLRDIFTQSFTTEETQYRLGAAINWQITPRMPLQLEYEYINISERDFETVLSSDSSLLPSFMRGDNLSSVDNNHRLRGSLSYWLTPRLTIGLRGELLKNQFTGIMPHFNNPLSGSFADTPYGYAGVSIGYRI